MVFVLDKKNCLSKADKSKKGCVDAPIKKLCDVINLLPQYYTTSSCSGRTVLLAPSRTGKKNDSAWLLCSHHPVTVDSLKRALQSAKKDETKKNDVWFRFEPPILHLCAQTIDDASLFLKTVYNLGFKRSGIITVGKKNIIEMMATERIDCPVMQNGKQIVDDAYLSVLVSESNTKLKIGHQKINTAVVALQKLSASHI